jgi:hypothetical protein
MSRFARVIGLASGLLLMGAGVASAGKLIGSPLTIGFGPNNFGPIATNITNFAFAQSIPAANQFAIFQTHDPWGAQVVKGAITGTGHTFTVFTPAQLAGFPFNTYRVVVLNWDDHNLVDFNTPYQAAIPALQTYINAGGVVWIQGSIQGTTGDSYNLPFGGTMTWDLQPSNFIVDPASPMMTGISNPINGNFASHARVGTALPATAHVVCSTGTTAGGPTTLYDLTSVPVELQGFTVE